MFVHLWTDIEWSLWTDIEKSLWTNIESSLWTDIESSLWTALRGAYKWTNIERSLWTESIEIVYPLRDTAYPKGGPNEQQFVWNGRQWPVAR
jgi:hypothetical protein